MDNFHRTVIAATALRVVAAAMAWPLFILELASSIDNAYSVALNRTDKVIAPLRSLTFLPTAIRFFCLQANRVR
eukprot:1035868-Amorphochlora_amoeboformis.AAC.1